MLFFVLFFPWPYQGPQSSAKNWSSTLRLHKEDPLVGVRDLRDLHCFHSSFCIFLGWSQACAACPGSRWRWATLWELKLEDGSNNEMLLWYQRLFFFFFKPHLRSSSCLHFFLHKHIFFQGISIVFSWVALTKISNNHKLNLDHDSGKRES